MRVYFYIVCISFCNGLFAQGITDGFYKEKHQGTIGAGFGIEDTQRYNAGRENTAIGRTLYYYSLYSDYAINDQLQISVSIPYLKTGDIQDFQDIRVVSKYKIRQWCFKKGEISLGLAIGISTPLANYKTGGLFAIGQQATIIESRTIGHYQFDTGWFVTLQSGFSYKLEEVPNSIPVTLKLGKTIGKWYFDAYTDYQHSFGGIDYLETPSPQNFRAFGVDYIKVGATLYYAIIKGLGAYINIGYVIDGRNIFKGISAGTGVIYSF